jgi:uracil-DNA glycosylase
LNPGGPEEGTKTIRQSLDELSTSTVNAYLDESWCSDPDCKGCRPLQKSFKFLFDELGADPRAVCASNLIFKRSADERSAGYPELAKVCWPVHEAILRIVQPHTIITFGDKTFRFVAEQLGGGPVQYFDSGHGNWACQSLTAKGVPLLVGMPHLSKYALFMHREVVEKIRSLIQVGLCPQTL